MSEFHLKKLFPNNNNNNNNNNLGISIDIKISFKFIQKKINFSYKKISNYKINNKKNFLYNYNNIYNNTSNYNNFNNNEFKTHRETSLNSTINTNRSAKTPIYMRKKLNNMNYSEQNLKNNINYFNKNENNYSKITQRSYNDDELIKIKPKCIICNKLYPYRDIIYSKSCKHIFCCECIKQYFINLILKGETDILNFKCPVPNCNGVYSK